MNFQTFGGLRRHPLPASAGPSAAKPAPFLAERHRSTGAKPLGDLAAELQHGLGGDALERLGIGIGADELHPFDAALDHVIDGIAAAATDADDLYDRAA